MYLGYDQECWKVTTAAATNEENLSCSHEEADTRVFLHAKSAAENRKEAVVIVCEDTDVFVLGVSCADQFSIPIYQKRGTQNRTRYVNISNIARILGNDVSKSLPGLHAFTGCDTVSAFSSKGKMTALKLLQSSPQYQMTFNELGTGSEVS